MRQFPPLIRCILLGQFLFLTRHHGLWPIYMMIGVHVWKVVFREADVQARVAEEDGWVLAALLHMVVLSSRLSELLPMEGKVPISSEHSCWEDV